METRAPIPTDVDVDINLQGNLDRRASLPSTEGSLSPAPSHDNLLSASSSSLQAHQYPERPGSTGLTRSHSGSPLISPAESSSAFVYPGRIDTGDRMAGAGYVMDRVTGAGERDVASHASRYGYDFDPNEQTPTQAGPSRWREAATPTTRTSNAPARSLDYKSPPAARAPAVPSRHGSCELCALVEQCRAEGAGRTSGLMWERRSVKGRDVVHADDQITVYEAQGKERMTRPGKHLVVVINIHAESVYQLGPVDVPLLSHMSATARSLLSAGDADGAEAATEDIQIGFVGTLVRDPMSPHTHLHAQAIAGPIDTSAPGSSFWRRNVVFAGVNWYGLDDLRAEIREETSNNRVKSGYEQRKNAPIDHVPAAGSIAGPASALDAEY